MVAVHMKTSFQFEFIVERRKSGKGYVAVDDVEFQPFEVCEFTPPDAKPATTTTIEPTEPPNCM